MTRKRGNNEGTIYQRPNGKWRAQITLNSHRLGFTALTRFEAQEWLRSIGNQVQNGLTIKGAKITYGEFLEEWLESVHARLTDSTWRTYSQLTRAYIAPALGKIRLRELSPSVIQRYYSQMVSDGTGLRTVQKSHTVIHASLNAAMKLGIIGRNPDDATQPPKPVHKEMKFWNQEQVQQFLSFAKETNDRNYALYFIALVTGMRQGELLALKWQDVDLEKETLTVKLNLHRLPGGGLRLQKPKTKTSIRTIRLGKETLKVLAEQKELTAKEKSLANGLWQDEGYVFPSSIGSAMDASNLWKNFRRILKQSKLPGIRFHDLRHTAASLMLNNGVDVLVASRRLGHAKPSITLDVYGHLIPSSQAGVADVLDKLVSGK